MWQGVLAHFKNFQASSGAWSGNIKCLENNTLFQNIARRLVMGTLVRAWRNKCWSSYESFSDLRSTSTLEGAWHHEGHQEGVAHFAMNFCYIAARRARQRLSPDVDTTQFPARPLAATKRGCTYQRLCILLSWMRTNFRHGDSKVQGQNSYGVCVTEDVCRQPSKEGRLPLRNLYQSNAKQVTTATPEPSLCSILINHH